MSHANL